MYWWCVFQVSSHIVHAVGGALRTRMCKPWIWISRIPSGLLSKSIIICFFQSNETPLITRLALPALDSGDGLFRGWFHRKTTHSSPAGFKLDVWRICWGILTDSWAEWSENVECWEPIFSVTFLKNDNWMLTHASRWDSAHSWFQIPGRSLEFFQCQVGFFSGEPHSHSTTPLQLGNLWAGPDSRGGTPSFSCGRAHHSGDRRKNVTLE